MNMPKSLRRLGQTVFSTLSWVKSIVESPSLYGVFKALSLKGKNEHVY